MKIGIAGLSGMSVFMTCDHFHAEGETVTASSLRREPGGKGYNQAIAAQRLGAQVFYCSSCGDDFDGQFCRREAECEHIVSFWEMVEQPTAFAHILTDSKGRNRVTVYRGAADALSVPFVRQQKSHWLDCDVLLLNLECPVPVVEELLRIGEEADIPVILNPAPALPLDSGLLHRFSLLTPNEQEAAILLGLPQDTHEPLQLAQEFMRQQYARVVVTLGQRGALVFENEHAVLFPALSVPAVDTTGAGDCFNAALAVCLAQGKTLFQAAEYAINASAYSVQHPGVLHALPTAQELNLQWHSIAPCTLF